MTKEEAAALRRQRYAERRAAFFDGKACVDCGSTEDLHVDHRDPAQKVSHRVWTWSAERREAELAKCDVRCRSCHYERHARELRRHGGKGYKRGCRCEICTTANRDRVRRWRARKKEQRGLV